MNLIQILIRSNLNIKKIIKFNYIYINRRQLDKLEEKLSILHIINLLNLKQIEFEDLILINEIKNVKDDRNIKKK